MTSPFAGTVSIVVASESWLSAPQLTIKIVATIAELTRKFLIMSILASCRGQLVIFEAISQSLFRKLANAGLGNLVNEDNIVGNLPFSDLRSDEL